MTQPLMDDYIRTMKRVGDDEASREHIARAVDRERIRFASASVAVSACTASTSERTPRRALHITAIAACAALLAIGGAIALPRLADNGKLATPMKGMQGFALAAYADGSPVEGASDTVMTSTDIIMGSRSWSEGDDGSYETEYTIDPSVIGNDVVSVEYRSTNENVVLEGMRDRRKVRPGESPGTEYLSSIVVGGPDATLPDLHQLDLRVTVPATDAIKEASEISRGLSSANTYDEKASDRLSFEVERACAEELASGTLEITATFENGGTQTHAYRIVPVRDFEELWQRDQAAFRASLENGGNDYEPEQLYALQQIQ